MSNVRIQFYSKLSKVPHASSAIPQLLLFTQSGVESQQRLLPPFSTIQEIELLRSWTKGNSYLKLGGQIDPPKGGSFLYLAPCQTTLINGGGPNFASGKSYRAFKSVVKIYGPGDNDFRRRRASVISDATLLQDRV